MKTNKYISVLLAAALAATATSCDENYWNDHELDGFEEITDGPITDVQSVEYTLTEGDYSIISSLSANTAIAGEDGLAALKAVGSLKRFSTDAPASVYVPAFLASSNFPYFTLTNGSAVRLTYRQALNEPEIYVAAQAPQTITVSDDFYQEEVWGENYINAFSPLKPAADFLPAFLADNLVDEDGTVCLVTYNVASQEPVFGNVGDTPAEPEIVFEQSFTENLDGFTMDNVLLPEELSYIWSWGGANYGAKASAYKDKSFASESWLISPVVDLTGYTMPVLNFDHVVNKFPDLAFAVANCTLWARTEGGAWKQVTIPSYTDNTSWTFGNSGDIDLSAFEGSKMQFAFKYVSEDDKSGTWEVKNLTLTATPAAARSAKAKADVPVQVKNAVYAWNGSRWQPATDFFALSPADYTAMGQNYSNLPEAEPYLSKFLAVNAPYAAADDIRYVMWTKYAGKATLECSAYKYDGTAWAPYDFVEMETNQFVLNGGEWLYDPNVTINLPAGKGIEISTLYYQACVDWVFENICKPLGDTNIKSGKFYVSSFGNNEYYSGTSAYQGNVDLRASAARAQYPAEYNSMSDEEIVALEKDRFMNEVMPGALSALHPEAKPIDGIDVLYTINFFTYSGTTTDPATAVFKVVGPGKFEPVSCEW